MARSSRPANILNQTFSIKMDDVVCVAQVCVLRGLILEQVIRVLPRAMKAPKGIKDLIKPCLEVPVLLLELLRVKVFRNS